MIQKSIELTKAELVGRLRKWHMHYFRCSECALAGCAHEFSYILNKAADYIEASGATEIHWTSVNERPSERGRYLCYFKYEPESPDVVCENTYYGGGHWMSEKDRITHWAPLPKLPI